MNTFTLSRDPYNLILAGVGGQGNVLASRLVAGMLVRQGYQVVVGETFGMSQRGGSVMSHVRVSVDRMWSPQIPAGQAHLVVTLEPVEALRVLVRYGNEKVKVLTNIRPLYPASVISGLERYPGPEEIRETLSQLSAGAWFLDATAAAVSLGNPILANVIMVGALTGLAELPLNRDGFKDMLTEVPTPEMREINLQAFDLGLALMNNTMTIKEEPR